LLRKLEGYSPLGSCRHRRQNNIKLDLNCGGRGELDSFDHTDQWLWVFMKMVINHLVPKEGREFCDMLGV
jgi:hypothetical protein